jgi:putative flippase GtrA
VIQKYYPHLKRPIIRYGITGLSIYILELVIIAIATSLGASAVLAVSISFWTGIFTSFAVQKFFTFDDKRVHHKILIPQLAAFSLLVLWNFGFTVLLTSVLEDFLPPAISRTFALGLTTIWNFYLYKTRIFKKAPATYPDL